MIIVDVNLLLYADNSDAKEHFDAKAWWEGALADETDIALAWVTILAFLRLTTNSRVMPTPLTNEQASDRVDKWLGRPHVHLVEPGPNHWAIYSPLVKTHCHESNDFADAHIAAIAIENSWELYSADNGFEDYPDLV